MFIAAGVLNKNKYTRGNKKFNEELSLIKKGAVKIDQRKE